MKHWILLLLASLPLTSQADLWQTPSAGDVQASSSGPLTLQADTGLLLQLLEQAPDYQAGLAGSELQLPLANGQLTTVAVYRHALLAPAVAAQHPQIRNFRLVGIDQPAIRGSLTLTARGLHGLLLTPDGSVLINPAEVQSSAMASHYRIIDGASAPGRAAFRCSVTGHGITAPAGGEQPTAARPLQAKTFGGQLKTYRLAVAATQPYSQAVAAGNVNDTLAAIVVAVDRVNTVFERDLGISLQLVSGSNLVSTDAGDFSSDNLELMIQQNQAWIDSKLGSANYDVGHLFSSFPAGSGGGLAAVASVCDGTRKAQAITGLDAGALQSDMFYIEYVAHEIGHQFGATHTFNAEGSDAGSGFCNGARQPHNAFPSASAYEPGSGSTIMSYAGLCNEQNLQNNSDHYFHAASIEQVRRFVDGEVTGTSQCGSSLATGETPPLAEAGSNVVIPASTPFLLQGNATGVASPSYSWEQYDLGNATDSPTAMHTDAGSGPLVRSRLPASEPVRSIPALADILANSQSIGERLPTTDRYMNFLFTVRSGLHSIAQDSISLQVDKDSGPFVVSAPAAGVINASTAAGVTWQSARTDYPPVSCARVDIHFSDDGGQSFPELLLANAPNTGIAYVSLPNVATASARLRLRCSDNLFFAVSPANFSIVPGLLPATRFSVLPLDAGKAEGDAGTTTFTFRVRRDGDTGSSATVFYSVAGSGEQPADALDFVNEYLPNESLVFSSGETEKTITVAIAGDSHDEKNETFAVTLDSTTNGSIRVGTAYGLIVDDDTVYYSYSGKSSSGGGHAGYLLLLLAGLWLARRRIPAAG